MFTFFQAYWRGRSVDKQFFVVIALTKSVGFTLAGQGTHTVLEYQNSFAQREIQNAVTQHKSKVKARATLCTILFLRFGVLLSMLVWNFAHLRIPPSTPSHNFVNGIACCWGPAHRLGENATNGYLGNGVVQTGMNWACATRVFTSVLPPSGGGNSHQSQRCFSSL